MNWHINVALRFLCVVAAAIVLGFGAAGPDIWAQQTAEREFKLGVILGFSGPASFWSDYQRMGIELALEELQREGEPIKVIWEDSKSTPVGAVSAFRKLADADRVAVVVGDIFGFVTQSLVPLAVQTKIPIVTPALPKSACHAGSGFVFTLASQISESFDAFRKMLRKLSVAKVALVTFDDPDWGHLYREVWLRVCKELQITVTDDVVVPEMTPDFKAIFPKIVANRPDAILFAHEPLSARKALQGTGFKGHFISANAVLEVLASETADKRLVDGVYLVDPIMRADFVARFEKRFGKYPILEAHASYEAIRVVAAARRMGDLDLQQALLRVKSEGVAGALDLSDPCRGRVGAWAIKQIRAGKLEDLSSWASAS